MNEFLEEFVFRRLKFFLNNINFVLPTFIILFCLKLCILFIFVFGSLSFRLARLRSRTHISIPEDFPAVPPFLVIPPSLPPSKISAASLK